MAERSTIFRVRVYYEDTDASGVVYHANYLRYFERARTEWLDAHGLDHRGLAAQENLAFTLSRLTVDFRRPARLDDRLDITTLIAERHRARVVFMQRISRENTLLIQGEFTVACVNIADFRPMRLPQRLVEEL